MAKQRQRTGQGNQVRIIGGEYRGRRLEFPDSPGLRPTADRTRETLFNWLQAHLPGRDAWTCLPAVARWDSRRRPAVPGR